MKDIVFVFNEGTKIWVYKNIRTQKIKKSRATSGLGPWWSLTIDNERKIYESIYDVINELRVQ